MILRDKIWDISAARFFKTLVISNKLYYVQKRTLCDLGTKVWVIQTKINCLLKILN